MTKSILATALAAILTLTLAGCGGGDDNGSGSSGSSLPAPPGTTYAAGSPQALAFSTTNAERERCGFGTLTQAAPLDKSATAHMNYMVLNNVVGHTEDPAKPGFTGVTPLTRAAAAGYGSAAIGEVISFPTTVPGTTAEAVRRLFGAPYHAQLMLDSARDIGIGSALYQGVTGLTMDLGFPGGSAPAPSVVLTYPCDGTTGVLAVNRNEVPSPLPDVQNATWGQPIMVRGPLDLRLTSATLSGPQGAVPIQVIYGDGQTPDPEGQITQGWAAVIPATLAPNTQYAVSLAWTARSQPGTRNFKFSTGPQ